jgi:hypothetical protein
LSAILREHETNAVMKRAFARHWGIVLTFLISAGASACYILANPHPRHGTPLWMAAVQICAIWSGAGCFGKLLGAVLPARGLARISSVVCAGVALILSALTLWMVYLLCDGGNQTPEVSGLVPLLSRSLGVVVIGGAAGFFWVAGLGWLFPRKWTSWGVPALVRLALLLGAIVASVATGLFAWSGWVNRGDLANDLVGLGLTGIIFVAVSAGLSFFAWRQVFASFRSTVAARTRCEPPEP